MAWISLIGSLLAFLGPFIKDLREECIKDRAKRVADGMPPIESFGSESNARRAFLTAFLNDLPKWRVGQRAAAFRAIGVLNKHDVTTDTVGTIETVGSLDDVMELRNVFELVNPD